MPMSLENIQVDSVPTAYRFLQMFYEYMIVTQSRSFCFDIHLKSGGKGSGQFFLLSTQHIFASSS